MSSPATTSARVLVQELAAHGVREVVLSPGSRSAPLAHALAQASTTSTAERGVGVPAIDLHVRIDERAAGFLALGLATGATAVGAPRPVAVVTTSGTAVANLHPAVLEASHAGVPLLVLTADRPHELRGTGANQTTDQVGIFGSATRFAADVPAPTGRPGEDQDLRHLLSRAIAAAIGARTGHPGPVHVNLAFREPLVPDDARWPVPSSIGRTALPAGRAADLAGWAPDSARWVPDLATLVDDRRSGPAARIPAAATSAAQVPEGYEPLTVVVAGAGAGPQARAVAEANGWPLFAEPSSGSRGGSSAIPAYRLLLGEATLAGGIRRVIVFGRPTLSRPVQDLLAHAGIEVLVVAPGRGPWPDAARRGGVVLPGVPPQWLTGTGTVTAADTGAVTAAGTGADHSSRAEAGAAASASEWLARWQRAGATAQEAVRAVLAEPGAASGGLALAREVAAACGPQDLLVVGSSNPIRDLDLTAEWEEPPVVLANRGLAGIDGTIATATGVALAAPGRRVRALIGDLTFLHDVGGLLRGPLERPAELQIIVANDDGGSIFAGLEHGQPQHSAVFERVFGTPHGADIASLCGGYGIRYRRITCFVDVDVDVDVDAGAGGDVGADAEANAGTDTQSDPQASACAAAAGRSLAALRAILRSPRPGTSVVEVVLDRAGRRELQERINRAVATALP